MNLFTKQKKTQFRKRTYDYEEERGGKGIKWKFGTDMQTQVCLGQITNKDLLYSTGNCSILCNNVNEKKI